MKRRFGISTAWVVATVVSILLASAAVATVRSEISERPSPLRPAALDQLASSTTASPPTSAVGGPSTTIPSSTTTVAGVTQTTPTTPSTTVSSVTSTTTGSPQSPPVPGQSTTTTTIVSGPTTTTSQPPVVTTSTTAAPSTSTTTTTQAQGEPESYELTGGFVRIFAFPNSVVVDFATPKPGFSVDIKKAGPPAVEVRFEAEDHTSVFKADFDSGSLDVDLIEQDKGGDG